MKGVADTRGVAEEDDGVLETGVGRVTPKEEGRRVVGAEVANTWTPAEAEDKEEEDDIVLRILRVYHRPLMITIIPTQIAETKEVIIRV